MAKYRVEFKRRIVMEHVNGRGRYHALILFYPRRVSLKNTAKNNRIQHLLKNRFQNTRTQPPALGNCINSYVLSWRY